MVRSDFLAHLGNLHTPVEQALRVQAVLVLSDVLKHGPLGTELGDQLQTGTWTDT